MARLQKSKKKLSKRCAATCGGGLTNFSSSHSSVDLGDCCSLSLFLDVLPTDHHYISFTMSCSIAGTARLAYCIKIRRVRDGAVGATLRPGILYLTPPFCSKSTYQSWEATTQKLHIRSGKQVCSFLADRSATVQTPAVPAILYSIVASLVHTPELLDPSCR